MSRLLENGGNINVPCLHIPLPEGFDVCWAGPSPLGTGLCFGSTDGWLLFADEEGRPLGDPAKASVSREAINGVVRAGSWVVVSTRGDVNFWTLPGTEGGHDEVAVLPCGAHGIGTTARGDVIAPLGRNGIMFVEPPFTPETSITALGEEGLNVYRVVSLLSPSGTEVLACAARTGGVAAGPFSGSQTTTMRTATFNGLDVIDICPLVSGERSLAVAALSRDGSIILFRDVLADDRPVTVKFRKVQGTAYRLLSHSGELYVLTSKGLYVLGKLAARFLAGELSAGVVTRILPLPMDAVDMDNACDRWLLVVMPDEVRRFDARWLHDNVPEDPAVHEVEDFQEATRNPNWQWHDRKQTARQLTLRQAG
jgi:hypothetical protein